MTNFVFQCILLQMKKLLSLVLTIALSLPTLEGEAQNLKPLTHDVYDSWKIIKSAVISNNGKYVAYELNPQLGDGWLHIVDVTTGQRDSIFRGASPQFSADSDVLLFRLKPSYDSVRKAKLIGLKKEKLPKDSVGILNLNSREQIRLAAVKQVQIPKESSEWLAVFVETAKKENKDSEEKKTKSSKKKKDNMTGQLVLLHAQSLDSMVYQNVSQFSLSDNGRLLAMVQTSNDSIDSIRVSTYNTRKSKLDQWFAEAGYSENIIVDKMGAQLAFTYSDDSAKNKAYGLYYLNMKHSKLLSVSGDGFSRLKVDWSVSPFGKIFFNDSGSELYFGSAIKPINEAKDTLTADEKVNVDIWNWKDPLLQTEQLEKLEREKKRSYTAVYFTKDNQLVQLGNEKLESIRLNKKSKGMLSLASTHRPYQKQSSWDGSWYNDYHIIDRKTGESKLILKAAGSSVSLSPQQKFGMSMT